MCNFVYCFVKLLFLKKKFANFWTFHDLEQPLIVITRPTLYRHST